MDNNTNEIKSEISPQNILRNVQMPPPLPQVPKPHGRTTNKTIPAVLIIVGIIAAVIFGLSFYNKPVEKPPASQPTAQNNILPSSSQMKTMMLKTAKISLAEPQGKTAINISDLPGDLSTFNSQAGKNIQLFKYDNAGKQGYVINYGIDLPLENYYFQFQQKISSFNFTFLSGKRADLIALTEAENPKYKLRAEFTQENLNSQQSNVSIQIEQK